MEWVGVGVNGRLVEVKLGVRGGDVRLLLRARGSPMNVSNCEPEKRHMTDGCLWMEGKSRLYLAVFAPRKGSIWRSILRF